MFLGKRHDLVKKRCWKNVFGKYFGRNDFGKHDFGQTLLEEKTMWATTNSEQTASKNNISEKKTFRAPKNDFGEENVHIVLVEYNWSGREFLLATMQHVFRVL